MEEIDIIELLKRIKEGKTPKKINIKNTDTVFILNENFGQNRMDIDELYIWENSPMNWFERMHIDINTKINILDEPKNKRIPNISDNFDYDTVSTYDLCLKIDDIIDYINDKETNG